MTEKKSSNKFEGFYMRVKEINLDSVKKEARILKDFLKVKYPEVKLQHCYEAVSKMYDFKDWNTFCSILKKDMEY